MSVLTHLAGLMRARGGGRAVVPSSVAGVRVRRATHVYGSARAGPDGVAGGLADAVGDGPDGDRKVVRVPGALRPVVALVRLVPRVVWRRMPR